MSARRERLDLLISKLEASVSFDDCRRARCRAVESALSEAVLPGAPLLPADLRAPCAEHYARHLVHRDPEGRFSVIAMVWAPGQGTPIHDHGGLWCVECVLQGRIEVRAYRPTDAEGDRADVDFQCAEVIRAELGESGHLIPPLDHHVICNPFDEVAVTLHVYGGDLDWCRVFEPLPEGGYVAVRKELATD